MRYLDLSPVLPRQTLADRTGCPPSRFPSLIPPAILRMGKVYPRIGALFTGFGLPPLVIAGICVLVGDGGLRSSAAVAQSVDYTSQIKPILTKHCVTCHGAAKPRGGLRLDTAMAALAGGKGGPAVLPGKGALSPLVEAIRGEGTSDRMPLNQPPLAAADIKLIQTWIDQGAKAKPGEKPGVPPAKVHWAFVPPLRPAVPRVSRAGWSSNPIDGFIQARLEVAGLSPSPEADRRTLIRRLSLDLTGLPPSPEEIDGFLADRSPAATGRAVDRLLASPYFGERWARLWLDQARYADSNGYNIDAPRSIWKYRDWVIGAINSGMPFDRFATEQLAGDLIAGDQFGPRIATGFHRNTLINQEGGIDVEQFRVESIVDRVNTTGTVFLGLSIGCAECPRPQVRPDHPARVLSGSTPFSITWMSPSLKSLRWSRLLIGVKCAERSTSCTALWPSSIPISMNAKSAGKRRWISNSLRLRTPTCVWRLTCRVRNGRHRSGGLWSSS